MNSRRIGGSATPNTENTQQTPQSTDTNQNQNWMTFADACAELGCSIEWLSALSYTFGLPVQAEGGNRG